jgi:DNA-binding MarR family transcriptional regulator
MEKTLREEIRQTRPFAAPEQEAYLAVLRTAAELEHQTTELLRPHGITPTQYNALRILRGAGGTGLCRNEVRDRLVARVPDATRLLDRMESMGLIEREREQGDRRFVTARITEPGRQLLRDVDGEVLALHRRQLARLDGAEMQLLIRLLAQVRAAGNS